MGQCWLLKGRYQRPSFCLADSVQAIPFPQKYALKHSIVGCWLSSKASNGIKRNHVHKILRLFGHPLLPELRYLIAQSLERQNKFRNATELLESLIQTIHIIHTNSVGNLVAATDTHV